MKSPCKLVLLAALGLSADGAKPRRLRENGLFYLAKSSKPSAASVEDATADVPLVQFQIATEMSVPLSSKSSISLSVPGANKGIDLTQAMGSLDLSVALTSLSVHQSIDYAWNGASDIELVQNTFDVAGLTGKAGKGSKSGVMVIGKAGKGSKAGVMVIGKAGKGSKSGALGNVGAVGNLGVAPSFTDLPPTGDAPSQLLPEVEPESSQDAGSNDDLWAVQVPTVSPSYYPTRSVSSHENDMMIFMNHV